MDNKTLELDARLPQILPVSQFSFHCFLLSWMGAKERWRSDKSGKERVIFLHFHFFWTLSLYSFSFLMGLLYDEKWWELQWRMNVDDARAGRRTGEVCFKTLGIENFSSQWRSLVGELWWHNGRAIMHRRTQNYQKEEDDFEQFEVSRLRFNSIRKFEQLSLFSHQKKMKRMNGSNISARQVQTFQFSAWNVIIINLHESTSLSYLYSNSSTQDKYSTKSLLSLFWW